VRKELPDRDEDEINPEILRCRKVGVTAGASTPNWLIEKIVKHLEEIWPRTVRRFEAVIMLDRRTRSEF
jgi:4-hydroxy-3-methylbut-2-enyl diphosphate reductase IspH